VGRCIQRQKQSPPHHVIVEERLRTKAVEEARQAKAFKEYTTPHREEEGLSPADVGEILMAKSRKRAL
jgi:hypothetical protein